MAADHLKNNRVVPLNKLTPHPRNYRGHPEGQVSKLVASLARFGQGRSIVVQDGPEGYLIVAGHGIVEAAKKLKYTELRADILPADWSSEQVEGYLVADNLHSQDAQDDETMLAAILQEQQDAGFDLASLGTDDEALRQLLEGLGDEYLGGGEEGDGGDEFDTTPEEGPTRTHLGEIWQLGKHRLLVGDSTKQEDVERLMQGEKASLTVTSPPYFNQRPEYSVFKTYADYNKFLSQVIDNILHIAGDPFILAWNTGDNQQDNLPMIADQTVQIRSKGLTYIETIIWRKAGAVYSNPRNMHVRANHIFYPALAWEPIIIFRKGNDMPHFEAEDEDSVSEFAVDVWDINQVNGNEQKKVGHPAIYPIEIPSRVILAYTSQDDICYEPFCGSGTTLIACERLHRQCRAMELEPRYADICLRRYEAETNQTATLLERVEEAAHVS